MNIKYIHAQFHEHSWTFMNYLMDIYINGLQTCTSTMNYFKDMITLLMY